MFEDVTVATFDKRQKAEDALRSVQRDGISIKKLSIVGVDPYAEEHALRYFRPGERILSWAGWAALWGVFCGLLFGPLFVHLPGYGNLPGIEHFPAGGGHYLGLHIAANPLALLWGPAMNALIFGVIGAIAAMLLGLNSSKDSVVKYENLYSPSKFLLILRGSAEEISRARAILDRQATMAAAI